MAVTRHKTGKIAPRQAYVPAPSTSTSKTTKTKTKTKTTSKKPTSGSGSGVNKPKANTSKPRAKPVAGGRIAKPANVPKKQKRNPTIKDKVAGAAKKLAGSVERKPGKKAAGTRQAKGTDGKGSKHA